MNKIFFLLTLITVNFSFCQNLSDQVSISETFSSNGLFRLKSISYDDEFPNLIGESFVTYTDEYESYGIKKNFYSINRSFDLWHDYPYFVAISNDGRKILYIKDDIYYNGGQNDNITYYVDGKLEKSYTTEEFINCKKNEEKCKLFYDNQHEIFKKRGTTFQEYKNEVSEKDKFLYKNYVFNRNDTIYVIDNRKKVLLFNLNSNEFINRNINFDSIYPKIKNNEALKSNVKYYSYPYKYVTDIKNSANNINLSEEISKIVNLKFISISDSTYYKYKLHKIELTGYIDRKGKLEIDKFICDETFDKNKILENIKLTSFKTEFIPKEVDKIYLKHFFGGYRNYDEKIATQETLKEKLKQKEEYKKRLTLDKINNIYIPKNLYECLIELDKTLNFENKKQLKEAIETWQFNSHMGGLGMWLRNNWGINGGSRLLAYFKERNIKDRDNISEIIIEQYINWLKGDQKTWKKWENDNPKKINNG